MVEVRNNLSESATVKYLCGRIVKVICRLISGTTSQEQPGSTPGTDLVDQAFHLSEVS